MYIPYFFYPFFHQWALGLLPPLGSCEQCFYEHECACLYCSVFCTISYSWNYTVCGLYRLASLTKQYGFKFSTCNFVPWQLISIATYLCQHLVLSVHFKIFFIDYAITVVLFPPFIPLHPAHTLPPAYPSL